MLSRLGMRAGEVAALRLEDVDWRAGELVIVGKGRRSERLPLPVDVGEAIVEYLQRGRPVTAQDRCCSCASARRITALTTGGVTQVVVSAARRAGLGQIHAHRLRHSAATRMLRAGAGLEEIGQVLRHRAGVDHRDLRQGRPRRAASARAPVARRHGHDRARGSSRRISGGAPRAWLQARASREAARPVPRLARRSWRGDDHDRACGPVGDATAGDRFQLACPTTVSRSRVRSAPPRPRPGSRDLAAGSAAPAAADGRCPTSTPTPRCWR